MDFKLILNFQQKIENRKQSEILNRRKKSGKQPVLTVNEVKVVLSMDPFIPIRKIKKRILQVVRVHTYAVNEIVWAKMKGFPLWPAKVINFVAFQLNISENFFIQILIITESDFDAIVKLSFQIHTIEDTKLELIFYGDRTRAVMHQNI